MFFKNFFVNIIYWCMDSAYGKKKSLFWLAIHFQKYIFQSTEIFLAVAVAGIFPLFEEYPFLFSVWPDRKYLSLKETFNLCFSVVGEKFSIIWRYRDENNNNNNKYFCLSSFVDAGVEHGTRLLGIEYFITNPNIAR